MTDRTPIVVLHGALGSAAQMQPVADALASLGTVHLLELPGHGETPMADASHSHSSHGETPPFSIEGFADHVAAEVAARGVLGARCFGYSMGGYVALALEARRPGTFGGIVTLGTKFDWTPEIARRESAKLDADTIRAKVPRFADVLATRHAGAGGWELLLTRTAQLLRTLGDTPVLTADTLRGLRADTHLAVGSRDDTVTAEETARVALWCGGRSSILDDVPHPIERVPVPAIVALVQSLARAAR